MGAGGYSDGSETGSKRPRMIEPNPYFSVSGGSTGGLPLATFPVVRLRGLPYNCTDVDIFKFFSGLEIVDLLLINKNGRFSGEAFAVFTRPMQADLALQKNHQNMGRRYIEVFKCKKQEYYNAVAAEVQYEQGYDANSYYRERSEPSRSKKVKDKEEMEYTQILKPRGLPFTVKKSDILEFFEDYRVDNEKVHIACRPDGKVTGEAYVAFESTEEAKRAMVKDRMLIGSRYVELFPSTPDEVRRAESRSRH